MLPRARSYEEILRRFRWGLPQTYNIGVDACDKWAGGEGRLALIHLREDGRTERYTFDDICDLSNRLANSLTAAGVRRGDRVGVLLPQCPETAVTHIATYKMGAIAVPLFTLFGPEALKYRLAHAGVKILVTDRAGTEKVADIRGELPELRSVVTVGPAPAGALSYNDLLDQARKRFKPIQTSPDDPALMIYTSGTTGPPKGALHGHRVLLGHLPGVEMPQDLFPKSGDRFWTPADWAWIGGLLDVLLPAWHHGVPVVAHRMTKFDPEKAFHTIAAQHVRNLFLPPTALKLMRTVSRPRERWKYSVRSIGSGGETLGEELIEWGRETFGLTVNEFYGQTECNLVLSNCARLMPVKPGSMGRRVPGHVVSVIDDDGEEAPPDTEGAIAVRRPDPVMFLGYWNDPEATARKFVGDWLVTGDRGTRDTDGYFRFLARDDDVITSGGYRIGPGEIEDCLIKHEAVAVAAAVGVPDPIRTERVKAFIVLKEGFSASDALARDIQTHVKERLAAHEYPREIEFVDTLPMTATGKIMRKSLKETTAKA